MADDTDNEPLSSDLSGRDPIRDLRFQSAVTEAARGVQAFQRQAAAVAEIAAHNWAATAGPLQDAARGVQAFQRQAAAVAEIAAHNWAATVGPLQDAASGVQAFRRQAAAVAEIAARDWAATMGPLQDAARGAEALREIQNSLVADIQRRVQLMGDVTAGQRAFLRAAEQALQDTGAVDKWRLNMEEADTRRRGTGGPPLSEVPTVDSLGGESCAQPASIVPQGVGVQLPRSHASDAWAGLWLQILFLLVHVAYAEFCQVPRDEAAREATDEAIRTEFESLQDSLDARFESLQDSLDSPIGPNRVDPEAAGPQAAAGNGEAEVGSSDENEHRRRAEQPVVQRPLLPSQ